MTSSSPPPPHTSPPHEPKQPRRPRNGRIVALSLAVSLVLHLVVIVLYPIIMDGFSPEVPVFDPDEHPEFRDVPEIVLLQPIPDPPEVDPAPAPVEEEPVEEDPVDPAEPAPPPPDAPEEVDELEEVEDVEEPDAPLTPAERLRPQLGDARLWVPADPSLGELTPEERAQLMIRGMIQDWNDSVAIAEAVAAAGTDWTITDDEGRRWGVSPGRLHLGNFSIPLPFHFSTPGYLREDAAFRQWEREDIQRGAANQQIRETWAERAREIRRRMDAERGDTLRIQH